MQRGGICRIGRRQDPGKGIEQKQGNYWLQVSTYYHTCITPTPLCNASALGMDSISFLQPRPAPEKHPTK